jgi:cysteine desulfurase/selenocysteine lyase
MSIEHFKECFFQEGSRIHLNNAGLAPITKLARDKIFYWGERFYKEGFYTDHDYVNDVAHSRENLAMLVGCHHSEIAFFTSTASAVTQLAFEYPLNTGDEVIMWAEEYASHLYPWQEACKRKGANLVLVKSEENLSTPYQSLVEKITPKTKVIAVSWVQFLTGAKTDLKALSKITKSRGIFLFVDIIQGLGLHPFNMKEFGVDALAGGSHKWLFSPVGVGFLAIDSKHIPIIKAHTIGAYTFGTCDDPTDLVCTPKKDALKYEPGSKQVLEITALGASIDLILKTGVENIEKETLRLSQMLRSGLEEKGYFVHSPYDSGAHQSSIVNFIPKTTTAELLRGLPCNFAMRGPGVRLSTAAFIKDEVIEKVLVTLS